MSKFDSLLKAAGKTKKHTYDFLAGQTSDIPAGQKSKIGRPPGKRSNPDFQQVAAWMRKDTYKAAQLRLLEERKEFSVLVQELVQDWLQHK